MNTRKIILIAGATGTLCALTLLAAVGCSAMAPESYRDMRGRYRGETEASRKSTRGGEVPDAIQKATAPLRDPARPPGMVVYSANLNLVVERISESLDEIRALAEAAGGYLTEMDSTSITVKVPAARFAASLAAIEKLGEVTLRNVHGADVGATVRDLATRLKNAEETRKRLVALLDRAGKVEELLKVEKELERVAGEIESLKAQLQHLENSVAYSQIAARLNSPLPQEKIAVRIPFPWLYTLGIDMSQSGATASPSWGRGRSRGVQFDLPEGYIKYHEQNYVTRAMSADGVLVRLGRQENYEGGDAEFWSKLARRVLAAHQAIAFSEVSEMKLASGAEARLLSGSKTIAGKPCGYLAAVITDTRYVYVFEAWGPKEALVADRAKLEKAIGSLRIRGEKR